MNRRNFLALVPLTLVSCASTNEVKMSTPLPRTQAFAPVPNTPFKYVNTKPELPDIEKLMKED